MTIPDNLRDKYEAFFIKNDAGRYFLERLEDVLNSNLDHAMDVNSLDYLSRAKGNQEAIDLVLNVINSKEKPSE